METKIKMMTLDQLNDEHIGKVGTPARDETYQYAIDDMESTLDYVPERPSQGGRLTKGAIQHYLCEHNLALG